MSASFVNKDPKVLCQACGKMAACFHHVKTRGAGGPDDSWNLMPLCQAHHNEIHMKGNTVMVQRYPQLGVWLESKSWDFDHYRQKWCPPLIIKGHVMK